MLIKKVIPYLSIALTRSSTDTNDSVIKFFDKYFDLIKFSLSSRELSGPGLFQNSSELELVLCWDTCSADSQTELATLLLMRFMSSRWLDDHESRSRDRTLTLSDCYMWFLSYLLYPHIIVQ